jgi:hypothetical protein
MLRASLLSLLVSGPALAEGAEVFLSVELNTIEGQGAGCRLTFVVENALGADIGALVIETVLFDRSGEVVDLTLFDFQDLPEGSPRVRRFDLGSPACADLSRVLLNDVHACSGQGLEPARCAEGLRWSSRTEVEVLG